MRKFLLTTLGHVGLVAVVGTSAFAMSKTCEAIFDRCTASAGDHWEKCIFMADRCEIELRKQQEREEAKKHPPDAVTGAGKRVPRGSKGPSKREAGGTRSGSGEYEVTYRSASGGNGKIIWVVMPDGSTVPVRQGVPGGAFLTKVIDGKTYTVEFVKTVDGVSYNVADPAYETASLRRSKNQSPTGRGLVARLPARRLVHPAGNCREATVKMVTFCPAAARRRRQATRMWAPAMQTTLPQFLAQFLARLLVRLLAPSLALPVLRRQVGHQVRHSIKRREQCPTSPEPPHASFRESTSAAIDATPWVKGDVRTQ